ncbi:MAG: DUF2799 domain-containing protein [Pseudomonadota bacterium]
MLALLGGCGNFQVLDCASTDWEALGVEDGAAGADPETPDHYRTVCDRQGSKMDLVAYRVGTAAGLRRYCVEPTAFALGARGDDAFTGCPDDLSRAFARAYADGRTAFEAEQAAKALRQQIRYKQQERDAVELDLEAAQVQVRADGLGLGARAQWLAKVNDLNRQRQALERELAALQGQLATTQSLLAQATDGEARDP